MPKKKEKAVKDEQEKKESSEFDFPLFTSGPLYYGELTEHFPSRIEFEELMTQFGEYKKRQQSLEELVIPKEVYGTLPNSIKKVIDGIISNFENDFPDYCCWGIRKALIIGIDIRFKRDEKDELLFDSSGEPYSLPKKIEIAKQEKYLSSSLARQLTKEKIFGDIASHDFQITLTKEDIPSLFKHLRLTLDRLYSISN